MECTGWSALDGVDGVHWMECSVIVCDDLCRETIGRQRQGVLCEPQEPNDSVGGPTNAGVCALRNTFFFFLEKNLLVSSSV